MPPNPLVTLKKRADFLRIRGGVRWATPAFLMETKRQAAAQPDNTVARFGFTVTKKIGKAVIRNRIRRRLKAAVAQVAPQCAKPGYDYVLIARAAAAIRPYADLKKDLEQAFHRVHHPSKRTRRK